MRSALELALTTEEWGQFRRVPLPGGRNRHRTVLEGLPGDACQAPHWGYMIEGGVVVTYEDGTTDTCRASDVFYWPPGHSVRVTDDAEVIMFSPQLEHTTVLDHMLAKMTAV